MEDTWIRKLKSVEMFYMNVSPMALLKHLQLSCTEKHALDLLALQNEMQRYHVDDEVIRSISIFLRMHSGASSELAAS